jgi:hypothetical protein
MRYSDQRASCAGLIRASTSSLCRREKDVGGRNKSGHDVGEGEHNETLHSSDFRQPQSHAGFRFALPTLQPEQLLRITVRNPLLIRGADRDLLQEGAGLRHGAVGVIDREHDALGADFEQEA